MGIDLGTTNSAVAYIVDGHPVCIPNALGDSLTPSVVSFQPDGTTLVGLPAKQAQSKSPGTTYYSVKRLIGRSWSDAAVQEEAGRLAYPVRGWSLQAFGGVVTLRTATQQPSSCKLSQTLTTLALLISVNHQLRVYL